MQPPYQKYVPPITAVIALVSASWLTVDLSNATSPAIPTPHALSTLVLATLTAFGLSFWLFRTTTPATPALQLIPSPATTFHSPHAQTYLDQAHSLVLVLDHQGQVVYLNQHGYRLLGYPVESLQGTNWLQFCVPADHHSHIMETLSLYRQHNSLAPMFLEHPVLTAEGKQLLIAWHCTNVRPEDQTEQLLCAGRDVTTARQTQDTLHKLSCAVEQSSTSVMIFDRNGLIEYVNPSFTELTGFRATEVIGRKPTFLEGQDTDPRTLFELRRTIRQGNNWQGEVSYRKKSSQLFWARERISPIKDEQGQINHYVSVCEDITAERQHQVQIEHLAYHDQLTKLPNRRALLKHLQVAIEQCGQQNRSLTLFYINLDHFKRINDSLGQSAGDQLLCRIAEKLRREICAQDLIARHSSDEFILALHDLNDQQAAEFARRINRLVRQPLSLFNGETHTQNKMLTSSIGIACFPENSADANELIKFADLAMHKVKQTDRNSYRFFSQKMHQEFEADLILEYELQRAIQHDEFVLYYQPQVDLNQHRVTGLEALVRWQHPERGIIPPDQFISVAERSGLIVALGQHVLRKACMGYQLLDTLGLGHIRIAINLSALQFRDPLFPRTFQQTLLEFKVKPSQIELELTESMLMTNIDEAINILQQLKQSGATLAIDDFGTGYSSLSYLKQLPVDIIKVDRSFVKDIPQDQNDMEITAAVIAMAHKLKLEVVAEGVETSEQEQFLRDNECEYVQGYLYSPPVPEAELAALIDNIDRRLSRHLNNCVQLEFDS
ncbi:MAG: EAL domain-containing protein [Halopseudomonas sp.]